MAQSARKSPSSLFAWLTWKQDAKSKDDGIIPPSYLQGEPTGASPSQPLVLKTYRRAWFALFLLVVLRMAVSIFQYTFSIIPNATAQYFGVSLSAVNWLANVQCIIYVLVSFFTGFLFEKWGVKHSLIIAGFLCAIGSAIRCIATKTSPPSFILTMIGQIVGGAASPFALNIMTMTVFPNPRRTVNYSVASNYGAIIVMFVIPALVDDVKDIPLVVNLVAVFATVSFLTLLMLPSKPPTPPTKMQKIDKPSFFKGLRLLSTNYNFWIVFLIHSFNVGLSIAFCALYAQILGPHGYSEKDAGQLNALAFFAGTLGCTVAGPLLDLTKRHKLFLKSVAPLVFGTDLAFIFLGKTNQASDRCCEQTSLLYLLMHFPSGTIVRKDAYLAVLLVTTINQFVLSFLVPVVIELGSETTYPVAEATTNSLLWQGSQLFGFIFVSIMDATRNPHGTPANDMKNALIFQAVIAGTIMLLSFAFRGRMVRSEAMLQEEQALEKIADAETDVYILRTEEDNDNSGIRTTDNAMTEMRASSIVQEPTHVPIEIQRQY
ncbi:major facilitator superfamily domain-containing protein [Mycotypha africana]|uniref:major facilitator superfamily domain-containing protein n=1 Tax=Mycotypha africana TaxID=64632 RepID=UPI002301091A|nr:major facilitator superfamily domain-containing protein [Mycotypha africana]KAI8973584.1 major facilitator superfamily domain-containing protein [Mycotypha africana]